MNKISFRLRHIIDSQGLTIRKFAEIIDASNGTISKCLRDNTDISSNWLTKILTTFPNINAYWLLTGEGEMYVNTSPSPPAPSPVQSDDLSELLKAKDEIIRSKDDIIRSKEELIAMLREKIAAYEQSDDKKSISRSA